MARIILVDDEKGRKVWLHGDRNGHLYSIDRTSGKCNWVVPIARVSLAPLMLVVPADSPWKTMGDLIADAKAKGARVIAGGEATGDGYFFQPTAIADVPIEADAMNHEPFGPLALIRPFGAEEEALEQANRLPYGLAAFAFTENGRRINRIVDGIESGMVGVNSFMILLVGPGEEGD